MKKFQNFEENKAVLKTLSTCKKCMRKNILKTASKELVGTICEAVDNLLNNNIPVPDHIKEKLHKYKCPMRKLVKKSSLKEKRNILVQKGGFLEYLIPAAISAISSLINNVLSSD